MSFRLHVTAVVLATVSLLAACDEPPSDADRAYLDSFCQAIDGFSDEVAVASSPAAIAGAFDTLLGNLERTVPPRALVNFHEGFTAYVREAARQPEEVSPTRAPVPPDDLRSRLASAQHDIPGCRAPTLFQTER